MAAVAVEVLLKVLLADPPLAANVDGWEFMRPADADQSPLPLAMLGHLARGNEFVITMRNAPKGGLPVSMT